MMRKAREEEEENTMRECEPVEECGRGGSTVFESLRRRVHREDDMQIQHHLQPYKVPDDKHTPAYI